MDRSATATADLRQQVAGLQTEIDQLQVRRLLLVLGQLQACASLWPTASGRRQPAICLSAQAERRELQQQVVSAQADAALAASSLNRIAELEAALDGLRGRARAVIAELQADKCGTALVLLAPAPPTPRATPK
jgi:hypothetical protein